MAKSYEEILEELREKTKNATYIPVSQRNLVQTINRNNFNATLPSYPINTTISLPTAQSNYENALQNFQTQSDRLSQNVQNQGIIVNKYSQNQLPTYNTVNDNRLNDWNLNQNYNSLNPVNSNQTNGNYTQIKLPTNNENLKKYSAYQQTDEFKNQEENVLKSKDELGYAKYKYNLAKIEEEDPTFFDKSFGTLLRGLVSFTDVGPKVRDGKGGYIELPSYNDLKQQQVQDSFGDDFWGQLGKVLNSATFEIGRIGSTAAMNAIAPGAGSFTYFGSMLRDSVQSAENEGYSGKEALIYGTLSTALEIGTEKLLGGTTKALTGGKASALNQGIANGLSRIMNNKGVINLLSHAGAEATEEFIQEFADKALRNAVLDENNVVLSTETLSDAIYSAAVGGLTGAFGSIGDNSLNITTRNDLMNTETQKKNSATVSDANILRLTSETDSGTSSLYNDNSINSANNQIAPLPSNNSNIANNIQKVKNNNIFSNQVDEVINGTFNKNNHMTVLEHTPQVLQELGVKDYPITLTANKLDRIMNDSGNQNGEYHGLGIETVKKIPQALQNPLDIVKSHNNSYVLTTDLSDNQNRQVIASIKIDGKGYVNDIKIDTNVMTSAYGRNNYDSWMKNHQENGDIVYDIDRGFITQKRDNVQGLQLPNEVISSNNNITQSDLNVKLSSSNNSNMQNTANSTQKIPTAQAIQRVENSNIDLPNPSRVQNPLEISQLTPEDASTTPPLPNVRRNRVNDGNSSFASNIQNKTNMLNEEQKSTILSDEEVRYYDKVANKESLEKAFERLNNGGRHETESWFAKDSENATATDVAEGWILLKQYADNNDSDGMVAVAKKLRDMGTKAGQTVQAFNIMARMTPEGMVKYVQSELLEAYDKMVRGKTKKWIEKHQKDFDLTPQETGAIMDIMKKVSTMEDGYNKRVELAKIQKIMTDKLPPANGAGIKSWMRISMLFNPKTQVRNVMGNAVIAPVNSFGDLFASMADKVIGSKTGYRTTGVTNIQNYVKGFKEGLYQSYNDFKQGINTRNIEGNRFEIGEGKSFNDNTAIGKSLNKVDSLLSFMLDAGDRAFYEATFVNSINNQLVLNNTTNVTQDMIDIATQEALSRTWQDNNNYTRFVLDIRKGLNRIHFPGKEGYGMGDVLIPFAKTPANLTKAIVDYSPAGLVSTLLKGNRLKNAMETGQFTPQMQHEFVQSLGKATAGTMLYVAGYALAKAGIVSGESDDDKDVRDFMKNTLGVNSYSIKIGDKSFSYDWAQPIAAPLSMMANLVQKQKENENLAETVTSVLDTGLNVIFEQSFLTSISDVLSEPGEIGTKIGDQLLDLPARAVPTFMKQIVDLTDGTQRQTFEYGKPIQSMINSVKAKIPGLSQTLAPSVDTMGREIQRYGGKNNIFNVFLNPANVSTENISESAGEIYRLYKETGNTNIMPRVAPYYINKNGEKISLNSSERSKYQKVSGNIIEKEIGNLLNSNEYKKMSDEKKSEVISNIVNYSYNVAQKEVLGTELSDTYQKVYEYSKIGDVSDYYAFRNSIDDTNKNTKKESITNYLLNSTLSDKELSKLYSSYYSSEETLEDIMTLKIPIKEYIKLDSQEFTTDYDSNGKAITNSKKNKIINYVNSLNLSIPQKAILIKSQYSSYDSYNKQIVNYVNSQNLSKFDKATLLKSIGFDNYNSYIVQEVNSRNISAKEKEEILDDLGFRIVNGRVYW